MIPKQIAKASQIDATQRIHYLYNNYYYDFIPNNSIPSNYQFNSDVLEYVIEKGAKAINAYQTQRYGQVTNAVYNRIADVIYSTLRFFAITTGKIEAEYFNQDAYIYYWNFECTGIDTNYEFSAEYGTAYGFKFIGACDEIFTLVLDQNGGFYGSEKIGNWSYSESTTEIINQIAPQYDPDDPYIYVPYGYVADFDDLPAPYISGKSLYFYCSSDRWFGSGWIKVDDFTDTYISAGIYKSGTYIAPRFCFLSPSHSLSASINSGLSYLSFNPSSKEITITSTHGNFTGTGYVCDIVSNPASNVKWSFSLPYYGVNNGLNYSNSGCVSPYSYCGMLQNVAVAKNCDLYLSKLSTIPTGEPPNIEPAPVDVPIPVEQIPDDPEDPIPQNPTPENVPGIPVNPTPIPLPPYVSIVSGNDDLWGNTIEYENVQEGLLPYISGLSQFEFPSFTDLISDFSGSLIWVAQIMSVLYNGTGYNILFVCLCLFSLVSVLIGAYKLWSSSGESDPYAADRAKETDPYAKLAPRQYWKERKSKRRKE